MTLAQQFPVSMQMERLNKKKSPVRVMGAKERGDNENSLEVYYNNEFRKWHIKLVLIIGFIIACLFTALVGIAELFNGSSF
jgi:hypothetical protein